MRDMLLIHIDATASPLTTAEDDRVGHADPASRGPLRRGAANLAEVKGAD